MSLRNRADWALYKHLMDGKYASDIDFLNTRYHSLDSSRLDPKHPNGLSSLGLYFRRNLWKQYMPDEALIQDRILNPPATTRAHARGKAIGIIAARGLAGECDINWGYISLMPTFPGVTTGRSYMLGPHDSELPDELLQELRLA